MAGIVSGDVEILVHTTAPSRGQDDARYRALAQSYLDFQPSTRRRLDIEPQNSIADALDGEADSQLHGDLLQSTQDERESRASYRPDEEDDDSGSKRSSQYQHSSDRLSISFAPTSSQLSFRSVLDNVDSPAFRARTPHHEHVSVSAGERHTQSSAGSCKAALSTVADSQPDYDRGLIAFSSSTQVLETYLQNQTRLDTSSPALPGHRPENLLELPKIGSRVNDIEASEDIDLSSSPSPQKKSQERRGRAKESISEMLPAIQEPITSLKRKQNDSISEFTSSPPLALKAMPVSTPQSPVDRLAQPSKRPRFEPTKPPQAAFIKVTKVNMTPDVASSMVSNTGSSNWSDALEIRPSLPRTSMADLTAEMLITDSLHQLKRKISSRGQYPFAPHSQTRELRLMERGYWLVNCEKWNISIRSGCWDFLGKYVGRDLAGWGVSCIRDAETSSIRVYCWGIIAEHIYLLLHMASASKIKGTRACWIGGDGTAVITMPS